MQRQKYISGSDMAPGTSLGCFVFSRNAEATRLKTVSPTGPMRHFWLNTTFVKYQSSKIKAFSWCVFVTDIQIHLWPFYLWHCCFIADKSWLKLNFGILIRIKMRSSHSTPSTRVQCHRCIESRAYAMKTSSHSCTMEIHTAGPQLRMGPAPSQRFY